MERGFDPGHNLLDLKHPEFDPVRVDLQYGGIYSYLKLRRGINLV
jgi:hypothetical protein